MFEERELRHISIFVLDSKQFLLASLHKQMLKRNFENALLQLVLQGAVDQGESHHEPKAASQRQREVNLDSEKGLQHERDLESACEEGRQA